MKRILLLSAMLMIVLATSAMPLFNVPTFRIQPDGDTLHCFVSGDEYYNRLHDSAGYTIVHNPQSGWWVYADTLQTDMEHWQLVPTDYVAGRINPHTVASLVPNLGVDRDTWLKKQHFEENIEAQPLEGIPTAIYSFTMAVHADGIEVVGAAGQVVILCDVMGRTLWRSVAGQSQFIPVSHAGVYLLRVGDQAARKVVFR